MRRLSLTLTLSRWEREQPLHSQDRLQAAPQTPIQDFIRDGE